MSEEHILIVHPMNNQQSVWPAGINFIKSAVILLYSVIMFIHALAVLRSQKVVNYHGKCSS